jgi:RNA ligase
VVHFHAIIQYEAKWDEITLACRGLILNGRGNIVARPFEKFFNYEEFESGKIPDEEFEVYEKMDGSLGILYWLENEPQIASRGSFMSEQAIWATDFLHKNHTSAFSKLNKNYTYLFEIIYPENRIVVDYEGKNDLVLLGIIENQTGKDLPLETDLGFSVVKSYAGLKTYNALKKYDKDNFEGFVLKYSSGLRVKIKLEEYIRLHKILTNLSTLDIWECLAQDKSFDDFLNNVPDEFYVWVKTVKADLEKQYQDIETQCKSVFKEFTDRKEAAAYNLEQKYPMILFKMMDKKKYDYVIWKLIKPKFSKAFSNQKDE